MSRPKRNIAASVGRWSARHRKTAVIGWITFVVLAFFLGGVDIALTKLVERILHR
jgi:RND superfamily putative drug exporter